ncbi:MAG TPA: LPS assembly protein LptD [Acidiferrobacterales bacterium]
MPRQIPQLGLFVVALLAATPLTAAAADGAPECPVAQPTGPPKPATDATTGEPTVQITADRMRSDLEAVSVFSGNVRLSREGASILADEIVYDHRANRIDAKGDITLSSDTGHTIRAPALQYRLDDESGYSEVARFTLSDGRARGEAGRMWFDGSERLWFEALRYTTCPPGQNDWFLKARSLKLDRAKGLGTARNVTLEFMHVPFFYSPYFSFPITDQRQTGFLVPKFGYTDNQGFVLAAPYYINVAPNYDDTFTPRFMSRRGLQLQNEFRYLTRGMNGSADLEYLPNDSLFDDYRAAAHWRHSQGLPHRWGAAADIQWVSDGNYFSDLGETTAATSATHVPRSGQINYAGDIWRFTGRTIYYQTLDETIPALERPFGRMPQLTLTADWQPAPNRPHVQLDSEWVYFTRGGRNNSRLDLAPGLSLPLRNSYGFVIPKVGARYTGYHLDPDDDGSGMPPADVTPERFVSLFSVDTGLLFERALANGGRGWIQTLEPRLYYLYVPYENQDTLPLFDTGFPDFSYYNLFRENRFVGSDRVGDANQLTVGLSSRFLDARTGAERMRLSAGGIVYFDDRRVDISTPAAPASDNASDLVAELYAHLADPWYLRGGLQWDTDAHLIEKGNVQIQYHPRRDRIVNLGYRYIDNLQEQADFSAQWPLARRFTGIARWNYSVRDKETLQAYAGIEYNNCCWALRVVTRQRILSDGAIDKGVIFELELTGLGKLGVTPENPLQQGQFIFD